MMNRSGNLAICTIRELSEHLADSFDQKLPKNTVFEDCSFGSVDPDNPHIDDLEYMNSCVSGWFGIKKIPDAGFETEGMMLLCDYYGGCCEKFRCFHDFNEKWEVAEGICWMIIGALEFVESCDPQTTLLVDFYGGDESACN